MFALSERVQRVRLLLDTLDDPYPRPGISVRPDSGPAPSRYVPCDTCRKLGELRTRQGWQLCLVCDGVGWKRREGEPPWDAYLELPLDEASALPVEIVPKPIVVDDQSFAWERQRARYDRHGSYQQLRTRLDRLALTRPARYWLVRAVLVEHEPRALARTAERELDLGVLQLALWMPVKFKVPPWLIERTNAEDRRETIASLTAQGFGSGEVARRLGTSKHAVQRHLRRLKRVNSVVAGIPQGI